MTGMAMQSIRRGTTMQGVMRRTAAIRPLWPTGGIAALVLMLALIAAAPARADCVCRCVDGQMQPLCSNSIDIPPVCMPTVCGIVPPSIAPIDMPKIPPIGTSQCSQRQVQNPATGRYEWRRVCE